MFWLIISILSFLWVITWIIIHTSLFKQAIVYRCKVTGMPLWTILLPMCICAISLAIYLNKFN